MTPNTPPMGWNSWNTFAQNIDETLILESADRMVESGMRDAGYRYLVIDDCWAQRERDASGHLVPNPEKFPHGMRYVSDYVHSKGLLFGMYSCAGMMTCAGYPGSFGHEFEDAKTFAEWGVDFLKYDYCYKPSHAAGDLLYRKMGTALKNCGRDILFSACSWGADNTEQWIRTTGAGMWRSTLDIVDAWKSVHDVHALQTRLLPYGGKGCFNDMDMLIVGMNGKGHVGLTGCSFEEYKTHFSLWALLASPLMAGCDLRTMDEKAKQILLNKDMIAINQDPLCAQPYIAGGHPWPDANEDYIWTRSLANGDLAIGFFNMGDTDTNMTVSLYDLGFDKGCGKTLSLFDVWSKEVSRPINDSITHTVKAHECIVYRASVVDA